MRWSEFLAAAPRLSALAQERFEATGLTLVGTLRRDGAPRISPCEFLIFEDDLVFGMMWRSMKALDLLRDPRCVVHGVVSDKNGTEGDVKLYGQMIDLREPAFRGRYVKAVFESSGFELKEPYHVFALDIREAAYVKFSAEGHQTTLRWLAGANERERFRRWTGSGYEG